MSNLYDQCEHDKPLEAPDSMKLSIELEVPHNLLSDVMITAFDGNYGAVWQMGWARSNGSFDIDSKDHWLMVPIQVIDEEGEDEDLPYDHRIGVVQKEQYEVTHKTLVAGMHHLLKDDRFPSHLKEIVQQAVLEDDAGMIDAPLADSIVQFGVYGKLVYG